MPITVGMELASSSENLIRSALLPEERLIWVGQPKRRELAIPRMRYLLMIGAALGCGLDWWLSHSVGPLPVWAQMELIAAGCLPMLPLWWLGRRARITTYAVTSRRLLMAVGPDRGGVLEVDLAVLGGVGVSRHRRYYGKVLNFSRRAPSSNTPVWTHLDSGKPDKWYEPWVVDDPESIRKLIESATHEWLYGSCGKAKAT